MRHVNTETLMTTDNVHTDEDKRLSPLQLGLLTVGLLTTAVGQSFIFAILPPLGREVNLTVLQINSIIASSALVFSAAATVWGRLCDQIGRKPVILIGLTGYAVGNFVFAMIFDAAMRGWLAGPLLFGLILLGRCSQAVVMSGTNPGAAAYAADFSSREHRTKALARLGTASSLGMIIGPIVAGALAGFGLLFPLYTASGLAALAAIVIALKLPPGEIREAKSRTNKRLRFVDPRLRLYLLCSFGGFTGFAGLQQTLGFRLQDMLSLSGTETAQYTGFALMVAALFSFAMQLFVASRFQGRPITLIRAGVALLLLGALVIAIPGSFVLVLVGMASLGAGLGLAVPAIAASASLAVSHEEQGAAAGLVTACPAAGFVTGPLICGFLYEIDPTFSALGAAAILIMVVITASRMRGNR
ncbi:multidrug resistance protein 2 [marine gamma proteobacterium HTCC2080]|nr:multidrug resistance protein 2 [marine gamma proteobacterium HTCC2080]